MSVICGPWKPELDRGCAAYTRPWVVRRQNPKWFGYQETLVGASASTRRFASQEKAQEVADELNKTGEA